MALTKLDLLDRLEKLDEITLCELLEVNSEQLVWRFMDTIDEKLDYLISELEDEDEEED